MSPLPTGLGLHRRQDWNKPEVLAASLNPKSAQFSLGITPPGLQSTVQKKFLWHGGIVAVIDLLLVWHAI